MKKIEKIVIKKINDGMEVSLVRVSRNGVVVLVLSDREAYCLKRFLTLIISKGYRL